MVVELVRQIPMIIVAVVDASLVCERVCGISSCLPLSQWERRVF